MSKIKIIDRLKGCLPNRERHIEELKKQVAQCDSLRAVMAAKNWHAIQGILDGFKHEAVRELGTKGLEERDWLRINHRMELLLDIDNEMLARLNRGDAARDLLDQMTKEKDNGRRTNH